jgi:putative transposase
MVTCRFLLLLLRDGLRVLLQVTRNFLRSRQSLVLENLALRSQLALFEQQVVVGKRAKPQSTPVFRLLWIWLSKCWPD